MKLIKQLFTEAECEHILENIGKTTNVIRNDIVKGKGITVHPRIDQVCTRYYSLLEKDNLMWTGRIRENIAEGLDCKSPTHLCEYKVGGYVNSHIDTITKPARKLTVITLVASEDLEGGNFYIEEELINLSVGDCIIFDPNLLHSVTEVSKGRRVAAVNWWE